MVLLDFGIITDLARLRRSDPGEARSELSGRRARALLGTIAYMAPEQAARADLGPPADMYSVGVVLYQALTGRLPFMGPPSAVLAAKQAETPPPPRLLDGRVPADLDELCMALLERLPARRPTGADLLRRLGFAPAEYAADTAPSRASLPRSFVGRQDELRTLQTALRDVQGGQAATIVLAGESGIGKSFLLSSFVSGLLQAHPSVLLLPGRCYERESTSFKGLDDIIDQLGEHLAGLPREQLAELRPAHVAALVQVFPALAALAPPPEPGKVPAEPGGALDPYEQRQRAFLSLRAVLERLGQRHLLVLSVDDLQWSDRDGLALLGELLRAPAPPRLLLLSTVRTAADGELDAALRAQLPPEARVLSLKPLPPAEARRLASELLRRGALVDLPGEPEAETEPSPPPEPEAELDFLLQESGGHPLYLDELVRQRRSGGQQALRLDESLWARVQRLGEPAQRLLAVLALSGQPLEPRLSAAAAGLPLESLAPLISELRAARLLRTGGPRPLSRLEPYHDRVRQAVRAHLSPGERRAHHRGLALALSASKDVPPERLIEHFREAGEPARAADCAQKAAEHAEATLAFERAAACYQQALELGSPSGVQRADMLRRLGEALTNAGRGAAAAQAFLDAASASPAADALLLRRRAAEQLLRSGHVDRGVALLRGVLAQLGLPYPETPGQALRQILWNRARLRIGRLRPGTPRGGKEALILADACRGAAESLAIVDAIRCAAFRSRFLLLAQAAGEPRRLALALGLEAGSLTADSAKAAPAAQSLLTEARRLLTRAPDQHGEALLTLNQAIVDHNLGRWRLARARLSEAEELLRTRCTGVAWEIATARLIAIRCCIYMGDYALIARTLPQDLEEAARRGDLFMDVSLRAGPLVRLYLFQGRVEAARQAIAEVMGRPDIQGFAMRRYYHLSALVDCALYEGDAEAAHQHIQELLPALRATQSLRSQLVRIGLYDAQGRTALLAAEQSRGEARARWLRLAEEQARAAEREDGMLAGPVSARLYAGMWALRGHPERALRATAAAARDSDAVDMRLTAAALRWQHGRRLGGTDGARQVDDALAQLREEGAESPERWLRAQTPGLAPK